MYGEGSNAMPHYTLPSGKVKDSFKPIGSLKLLIWLLFAPLWITIIIVGDDCKELAFFREISLLLLKSALDL